MRFLTLSMLAVVVLGVPVGAAEPTEAPLCLTLPQSQELEVSANEYTIIATGPSDWGACVDEGEVVIFVGMGCRIIISSEEGVILDVDVATFAQDPVGETERILDDLANNPP